MRIIGGEAKGRRLYIPGAASVRPTTERIKAAFFNIIQPLNGKSFLDLFAGTGNMGLEALSRGAVKAVFVEQDRVLAEAIEKNIASCCFLGRAQILPCDYKKAMRILSERHASLDILFADPPYEKGFVSQIFEQVRQTPLMAADGLLAIQHSLREAIRDHEPGFVLADQRRYGDTYLSFLRKTEGANMAE
jgi:16S rRNA (guanine966-N2)-methyltransferase